MSRTLDQETAASLAAGDPQKAYREISALFTAEASPVRLEIEILGHLPEGEGGGGGGGGGGSGAVVLRDGAAVAITKKGLVLAFFVARRVLQEALRQKTKSRSAEEEEQQAAALAAATAVLLLLDPEHLTAANTRKRLLLARLARAQTQAQAQAQQGVGARPVTALADEIVFVDSLLTSHLHRHTKSPTLWSHRRWLVMQRAPAPGGGDVHGDLADVVLVAAVRHPRNYYAWDHARWLVRQAAGGGAAATAAAAAADDDDETRARLVAAVRTWCFQHHTDTSGWSFLFYLLGRGRNAGDSRLLRDTLATTAQRAVALRWTGEAVWVFLRTATAALGGQDDDESTARFRDTAAVLQSRVDPASRDHQVLQQAQDWLARASSHG